MQSMTAFASHELESDPGKLTCEIRSVNQRFLDLTIKCPEFLRASEHTFRKMFKNSLSRGKVTVFIRFYPNDETSLNELNVNHALLAQLMNCADEMAQQHQLNNNMQVSQYINWPEMIIQKPSDMSALNESSVQLLERTILQLIESRKREGLEMKQVLKDRINDVEKINQTIRTEVPEINQQLTQKMKQKLAEIDLDVNAERFEQELAFQLQKIDIAEELDRLDAHIKEFKRILELEEPVGRRLDFLVQELNRESNTIGSKSASMKTSNASIDLKVAIEQMREQIQNIE
ncbi:YicC/YloC family endoribonuclease [Marinicella sediminis]|uniref:YicC/YloC family endoribonuclease n=1 Tax=Marinicella sediminis TaxID=1792834 RepID=A0ABV7J9Q8_9GAMM|nr:YicC/YloC family endoribonuclease [Marinicella sediminis]